MKTASREDESLDRLSIKQISDRRFAILATAVLFLLALMWFWYTVAADYSYKAVAGNYELHLNGEDMKLALNEDGTFQQTLDDHGIHKNSAGTWHLIGEGGVVFSSSFLDTPGQETMQSGQVYGDIEKALGLFITIHINHTTNEPVYQKRFLN
jgi:hypothetical protein